MRGSASACGSARPELRPSSGLLVRRLSVAAVACLSVLLTGCTDPVSDAVVLTADLPLHLEDHLDAATIAGSEVPADPESGFLTASASYFGPGTAPERQQQPVHLRPSGIGENPR